MNDTLTCPRCLGAIPNNDQKGQYPGAISRTDNYTEICSRCGNMEAYEELMWGGHLPQIYWEAYAPK